MNHTYYDKLIFELSHPGRQGANIPQRFEGEATTDELPAALRRSCAPRLPEVDEPSVARHYTNMSNNNFGVDTGFYPLGSCTMKYNPKINEEAANHPAFVELHPAASAEAIQGALAVYFEVQKTLAEVAGMSQFTLNPFAGAHGELTGLMVIRAYHAYRGDSARKKIIVPNSAHGTNPASAAVCGLEVVEVKSTPQGTVDVADLAPLLGPDIAGMMMTNPNTLGIFEPEIPQIAKMIHDCGGLMYYDGANLNPMLGICRPGDMGFDVMHINLHKTFSTPHGGGGPGSGPVGVRVGLEAFLPNPQVIQKSDGTYAIHQSPDAIGSVSAFMGNFGVVLRAYAYLACLGRQGLMQVGRLAVLNANYIKESLKEFYRLPIDGPCMHEFVFDGLRPEYGGASPEKAHATVRTLDVAKRLLDFGFHAPTIYFPLLFHEAMMIEPTETESLETLDNFIGTMQKIATEARDDAGKVTTAPHETPIRRPDDVLAVRHPQLTFQSLQL